MPWRAANAYVEPEPEACKSLAWSPSAAVWVSVWFHASALLIAAFFPASILWVLAGLAGNHLILAVAGMCPRSGLLGPNLVRLPHESARRRQLALTFDDGPDPSTTPHILDLLDRYAAKASFFCIAERAVEHAGLIREIVRRGHSVENHTCRHPHAFAFYGVHAMLREVEDAQNILANITGQRPRFFRPPVGLRNPFLDPVLARTALRHVSWTRRGCDGVSADPVAILRRLVRGLAAGDILVLHDGNSARSRTGQAVALDVLPALLEHLERHALKAVSLPFAMGDESSLAAAAKQGRETQPVVV